MSIEALQSQCDLITGRNSELAAENIRLRTQRDDLAALVARDQRAIQAYECEIAAREAQANDDNPTTRANLVAAVMRRRHAVAERQAAR